MIELTRRAFAVGISATIAAVAATREARARLPEVVYGLRIYNDRGECVMEYTDCTLLIRDGSGMTRVQLGRF